MSDDNQQYWLFHSGDLENAMTILDYTVFRLTDAILNYACITT